jgi:hypothetical protein
MAEVRHITLVDQSPAHVPQSRARGPQFNRRLDVPYHVVELNVSAKGGDRVLAVDAVDSGSVNGLAVGTHHLVRLDPAAPREAQLAGGTRRFATENRYHFVVPVLGCVLLGLVGGLGYRWRLRALDAAALLEPEAAPEGAAGPGREGAGHNLRSILSSDGGL